MWVASRHSDGTLRVVSVKEADDERIECVIVRLRIGHHRELIGIEPNTQVHHH